MRAPDLVRCGGFVRGPVSYRPLDPEQVEASLPERLPLGWKRVPWPTPAFENVEVGALRGLLVLCDVGVEEDGLTWMHVSLSRPHRVPSWEDVDAVKRLFVGDERWAYQVHPPRAEHYTLRDGPGRLGKCLHLWAPLEGEPPLPNFLRSRGGTL